ncbi:hypothetical protein [Pseudoduganella sp.]|uniref:hypothetical protein n=1 Tax=Pseudoduganella sp. TaxID=1880898 RepID=UPI0035B163D1
MLRIRRRLCLLTCALLLPLAALAGAKDAPLELRIAVPSDRQATYFIRLLEESLQLIHQPYQIEYVKDIPARRMWSMLGSGGINIFYGMQTKDKDRSRQLVTVRHGLTNGLIGQRVLLVRRGDADIFARVKSLQDLKSSGMVAGFGAGWGDTKVWKAADLPFYEHSAPWSTIYAMVAAGNRNVDYLPRGVNEVLAEARQHPELVVEQRLLMVYPGDLVFYLSSSAAGYRPIIERALREAESTGLKERLLDEAFGADIKALGLKRRLRLQLSAPAK